MSNSFSPGPSRSSSSISQSFPTSHMTAAFVFMCSPSLRRRVAIVSQLRPLPSRAVQRVLAVVGAVVLIVAAIAVRQLITGGDDEGNGGNGGDGGDRFVVACVTELGRACE